MSSSEKTLESYDNELLAELRIHIEQDALAKDAEWPFLAVGTIQDYLSIREKFEGSDWFRAGMCNTDELELLPVLLELIESGFPDALIARLIQNDDLVADELSCWLLSQLEASSTIDLPPHAASRGMMLKISEIKFVAALLLERCSAVGNVPNSLIYLIVILLVGQKPKFREDFRFRRFAIDVFAAVKRLMENGEDVTARSVAKRLGVAPSSITRNREKLRECWHAEANEHGEHWLFSLHRQYYSDPKEIEFLGSEPLPFPF